MLLRQHTARAIDLLGVNARVWRSRRMAEANERGNSSEMMERTAYDNPSEREARLEL